MVKLNTEVVFVFGSNLAGRHGKGAAWDARVNWGAEYGVGKGRTGYSYAIPTKDKNIKTLPLDRIRVYVQNFIEYAIKNPNIMFYVTAFGSGLAGYSVKQMLDLFGDITELPYNIVFTKEWILPDV